MPLTVQSNQHALHHADGDAVVLQYRALLDVGFKVRAYRVLSRYLLAHVADARQLVSDRLALGVDGGVGVCQREGLGENARTHHHRHETRAFLVGPEGDFNRRFGLDAVVVQGAHDFQTGQHTIVAVEFSAGRLGVDVAAGHDRRQGIVAAGAAHEAVADLVNGDGHAGIPGPASDAIPALLVQVGQRQAADAALGGGADLGEFHERGPKPFAVDAQAFEVGIGGGRSAHRYAIGCIS